MADVTTKEQFSSFLQGGGEMGRLTRNYPWAQTSLGSPQQWPASLRSALGMVLHSAFPMFLFWGDELRCFYNDAFRPSLGVEGKHPAIGKTAREVWPEIWDFIGPLIEQVMATGEPVWFEDQLVPFYRNGTIEPIYWTFSYSPAYGDEGKIAGVLVTCMETTQKVLNLRNLEESEDQLTFAIEASQLGTFDYSPLTGKFTANHRLKEWFGVPPKEEVELSLAMEALAPNDRDRVTAAIQQTLQYESGGFYDIVYTIVPRTGEARVVRAKGRAWFNDDKIAWRFNGTLQDITREMGARQKTAEAEAKARLAIDLAGLGTYEIDLVTDDMKTSARYNEIWGIEGDLSRPAIADRIHPDDRAVRMEAHALALSTGKINYEARVVWEDHSLHWVKVSGKVLYDEGNKPVRMLGVIQDITELKLFSERLTAQVKERTLELENKNILLERSNANLEEFAHAASHDMKEPVRKIIFFSDRLGTQLANRLSSEERDTLAKIENASRRMGLLIDDLLQYSHVSQKPFEKTAIDLNEKLNRVLEDLELDIMEKKAVITIGKLPTVKGYRRQLQQLFQNIISNALKYNKPGVPPQIDIRAAVVADERMNYHEITIKDQGIGFEQYQADRIFKIFERLHGKKEYPGTGVGLAIVKKVAENHQGKITVESAVGAGSVFKVYLPIL